MIFIDNAYGEYSVYGLFVVMYIECVSYWDRKRNSVSQKHHTVQNPNFVQNEAVQILNRNQIVK